MTLLLAHAAFLAVLAGAVAINALLALTIWRTMGPAGEILVRDALGVPRRYSSLMALGPFALCLIGAVAFVVTLFRTSEEFPPPPLLLLWFGAAAVGQAFTLAAALERRSRTRRRRKDLFGE